MCCLQAQRDANLFPTLGIIRPKIIERLVVQPDDATWTDAQLAILRQEHLWEKKPKKELEKVPFKFSYKFTCDHAECTTHTMICTDWEMGEAWRRWRTKYGERDWLQKFKQRFEAEMIGKYDTHFYVGTVNQHPSSWIIVGLFYPPKQQADPGLFDALT
jgi:hypothetical protein